MWSSPLDSWFLSSLYETLNGSYFESISPSWQGLINQNRGWVNSSVHNTDTVKQYYSQESTEYQYDYGPKIGLMYVSDYGYAASPENWSTELGGYNSDTNRNNNWLFMGLYEWTIIRCSENWYSAYIISDNGLITNYGINSNDLAVRPTFYLESSIELSGGSGTQTDPYRIA